MRNEKNCRSDMGEALSDMPLSKVAWSILLLLGFFVMGMHGSVLVKASEKEVTFEKVQEEIYEDFIRAIAFGSVVKDGEEQIYCKVIVLENKEVQFLDESGQVISRKPLPAEEFVEGKFYGRRVILSRRGNFVAIYDYISKPTDPIVLMVEEEFTICNDRGEEIYRIKGPVKGMGLEDRWLISDKDGWAVGTRIAYGALDFYSPDGEVKVVPLFGELGWRIRGGSVIFSDDGEYLALLVLEMPEPIDGVRSLEADVWVILFDKSGTELWRRKVDEQVFYHYKPQNIAISEKGEYLFFKAFTFAGERPRKKKGEKRPLSSVTLSLYDREGNELSFKNTSLFSFSSFCFSPQADYVALGGENLIKLIRTKDGSTVFEKELANGVKIRELSFSGDGEYLIVRGKAPIGVKKITEPAVPRREYRTVYTNRVFIFNMKGDQVWQNDFPELRGIFSENGFFAFSSQYKYEIYKKIERDGMDK